MRHILIALPTNRYIEPECMKSIYDLDVPEGYTTELQFFYGYQIDQVRNLIAEWGRRYDYLFCVDSDIILPKDALSRLIAADKDIASGLYIQRKPGQFILELYEGSEETGYRNIEYKHLHNKGLVEVSACGFGCVLVKGDVLRAMEYPHFVYRSALNHDHTYSEDIYFCNKARSKGFKVWADTGLHCEHIGQTKFVIGNSIVSTSEPKEDPTFKQAVLANFRDMALRNDIPLDQQKYLMDMRKLNKMRPPVIYDIGSCVLNWTLFARKVWPESRIIQFEPMQWIDELYEEHGAKEYANVLLTDQDGRQVKYYQNLMLPGGNSYYKENTPAFGEEHAVMRTGYTLDTIVKERGFPYPDMMKLDTQGSEIDILKGATECLKHCYDLIVEAQHTDYNAGAPKVQEVINYIQSLGFRLIAEVTHGEIDRDYHFKRFK